MISTNNKRQFILIDFILANYLVLTLRKQIKFTMIIN